MRIAFFTPLSPKPSALSDFGDGLALALASQPGVEVDVYIDSRYTPDNPTVVRRLSPRSCREFPSRARDYDVCLYSLGDHNGHHGYMLDFVYRYPGVVILNDLTLHRLVLYHAMARGSLRSYFEEMRYAYNLYDAGIAEQVMANVGDRLILEYPLFERVVDNSRGVVVQNEYARARILSSRPQARVACIPYPFFMPPGFCDFDLSERRARQRASRGLDDHFVVGSFGIFVADKHLEDCLRAFAHVARKHPKSHYMLGGFAPPEYDLEGHIRGLGLEKQVTITGWASPLRFVENMFALDVGIHLRYPHIGGTPYTPIRLMGLGVCTLVSDIEPLAELPQGACVKIAPDDYQEAVLTALLEHLADHPDFRRQVGENGRQFIERHHTLDGAARRYVEFLSATCAS